MTILVAKRLCTPCGGVLRCGLLASYGMHGTLSKQKSMRTVSTLLHRSECRFLVRVLMTSTVLEGVSCRGSLGLGTGAWEVRAGPPVPGCATSSGPSGIARLGPGLSFCLLSPFDVWFQWCALWGLHTY